jgi:hypothetical protein
MLEWNIFRGHMHDENMSYIGEVGSLIVVYCLA